MDWQAFGFKDDPLKTSPITKSTLVIFTGHTEEIKICSSVLTGSNVRLVIEGARGVGTTSFANYLRFHAESKKLYFTPRTEIKVEPGWRLETLLAAIISNFVREIELLANGDKLVTDPRFQSAKALSSRIAETYRAFGVDAFGFGASYGKQSGVVTQPIIVPSPTLGHHLEDLIALVREAGYAKGVIFQLNNLDIGEIHSEEDMKYLMNALRDYTQIEGSNWFFVGDIGLRAFIAREVDRLDDIISYEVTINPIPLSELSKLIDKRVQFYSESEKVELPIAKEVFYYLYKITEGRLRYVFGLVSRLMSRLHVGDLTDKVTLGIAKPMLIQLGRDRLQHANLSEMEERIVKVLVLTPKATPAGIAQTLKKSSQYVGRVFVSLSEKGLVTSKKEGRERHYSPSLDAIIAYREV